jgi:hypothetical protein
MFLKRNVEVKSVISLIECDADEGMPSLSVLYF